jgi:hypothetical protein
MVTVLPLLPLVIAAETCKSVGYPSLLGLRHVRGVPAGRVLWVVSSYGSGGVLSCQHFWERIRMRNRVQFSSKSRTLTAEGIVAYLVAIGITAVLLAVAWRIAIGDFTGVVSFISSSASRLVDARPP